MFKIFASFLVLTFSPLAFADSVEGKLHGKCTIFSADQDTTEFNFSLHTGEDTLSSKPIVIPVPLEGANDDIYNLRVYNRGISPDHFIQGVGIYIERLRILCDPPIMLPGGGVSTTPCSRPSGWDYLEGVAMSISPKNGDKLEFSTITEEAAVICKATFTSNL